VISAECAGSIGALLFEFEGAVNPTLLATNMEMMANGTKVLVWSRTGQTIQNAEVLSADARLVSVQAVDRDSRVMETTITARMTPTAFALHAAYPNPFNPFTNLSFSLPEAATYSLSIYNVAGQLVRSYNGMGSQGLNVITWDGRDNSGSEVSSGVYFYKLTAAGNSATEKMVMMK
jgi:flagellar hook assembly protein FlgD